MQQRAGPSAWAALLPAGDLRACGRSFLMHAALLPFTGLFVSTFTRKVAVMHTDQGIFFGHNWMHQNHHQQQKSCHATTNACWPAHDVRGRLCRNTQRSCHFQAACSYACCTGLPQANETPWKDPAPGRAAAKRTAKTQGMILPGVCCKTFFT